jgi:hypothetical protein
MFSNEHVVDELERLGSSPRNVAVSYASTLPIKQFGVYQSGVGIASPTTKALKSWIDGHLRTPLPTFFQTAAGGQDGQRVATTMVARLLRDKQSVTNQQQLITCCTLCVGLKLKQRTK